MPRRQDLYLLQWGLTLILLTGFICSCDLGIGFKSKKPKWKSYSLDTGPEVRVRLIRKSYFRRATIEWLGEKVVLTDKTGQIIPRPAGRKKAYFRMHKDKVIVAFKSTQTAFKKAKAYREIWMRTANKDSQRFTIHIPERRLVREYDARAFHLSVKYGRMAIINVLPVERYVAQVIPEEMDPEHFTLEALKAQAVVARTWALKNLGRHARYGYDFCDSSHCQVYKGRKRVSHRAEQAVKMTLGEVLMYQGNISEAFYHSTCGGNTVFVDEVWGGQRIPYLTRVEDHWQEGNHPYCAQSPYAYWRINTSLRRVERALRQQKKILPREHLQNVRVDFQNRSGRVKRVRITTDKKERLLTSNEFRAVLHREYGKRKILSHFYSIKVEGNQFRISGHGLGHGVGMCQWGARGMAQHGFCYREILAHYFRGTRVGKHYGVRDVFPSSGATTQNSHAEVK